MNLTKSTTIKYKKCIIRTTICNEDLVVLFLFVVLHSLDIRFINKLNVNVKWINIYIRLKMIVKSGLQPVPM
jgi:hypothetical protein